MIRDLRESRLTEGSDVAKGVAQAAVGFQRQRMVPLDGRDVGTAFVGVETHIAAQVQLDGGSPHFRRPPAPVSPGLIWPANTGKARRLAYPQCRPPALRRRRPSVGSAASMLRAPTGIGSSNASKRGPPPPAGGRRRRPADP